MKWADESVVVLVSHNELGHEELEVEEDGKTIKKCPLYPGLTCRQHLDIAVATDNSRDETLPVIPFVRLHPNSFLVLPTDKVEAIAEKVEEVEEDDEVDEIHVMPTEVVAATAQ